MIAGGKGDEAGGVLRPGVSPTTQSPSLSVEDHVQPGLQLGAPLCRIECMIMRVLY